MPNGSSFATVGGSRESATSSWVIELFRKLGRLTFYVKNVSVPGVLVQKSFAKVSLTEPIKMMVNDRLFIDAVIAFSRDFFSGISNADAWEFRHFFQVHGLLSSSSKVLGSWFGGRYGLMALERPCLSVKFSVEESMECSSQMSVEPVWKFQNLPKTEWSVTPV